MGKLDKERRRIREELEKRRARIAEDLLEVSRLETLQERTKKRAGEMIARDIHNLDELEMDELLGSTSYKPFGFELASSGVLEPLGLDAETPGVSQRSEPNSR